MAAAKSSAPIFPKKNRGPASFTGAFTIVRLRDAVPVPEVVVPIDPTAAGDGFNAGYLAARLTGRVPMEAAAAGGEPSEDASERV